MVAIYRAARLLAIVPREDELSTHQKRQAALALARGGYDPRNLDLEALGVGWLLDLPPAPPAG